MADAAEQFIDDAMTRLVEKLLVANASLAGVSYLVHGKEVAKHGDAPRIEWLFGRCQHRAPSKTGGTEPSVLDEVQTLMVRIWHLDYERCRLTKNALLAVCKQLQGSTVEVGEFTWPQETQQGVSDRGVMMQGAIAITLPVPKNVIATQLALITSDEFIAKAEYSNGNKETFVDTH